MATSAADSSGSYEQLYARLEKLEAAVRSRQSTNLAERLGAIQDACRQAEENAKGFATFKKLCACLRVAFPRFVAHSPENIRFCKPRLLVLLTCHHL